MKKLGFAVLILIVLVFSVACKGVTDTELGTSGVSADYEENEFSMSCEHDIQDIMFYDGKNILVDAANSSATYNDGVISYSWSIDKWYFELYKGYPKLEKIYDGVQRSFFVMDEKTGIAENLSEYAVRCIGEYFSAEDEYWMSNVLAFGINDYFTEKGYLGVQTGYCNLTPFDEEIVGGKHLAIVNSITDGNDSVVICMLATGLKDNITRLHSEVFPDGSYSRVFEDATKEIIESFEFVRFE